MKYTVLINQKAIIDQGLDIDFSDGAIIDWMLSFSAHASCQRMVENGQCWYWFSYSLIVNELPMLRMKKDSVYRRMKNLAAIGLIIAHPKNMKSGQTWFSFTPKMGGITHGFKSEPSDENPHPLGFSSVPPSDFHPTNNTIIDNNINNNTERGGVNEKEPIGSLSQNFSEPISLDSEPVAVEVKKEKRKKTPPPTPPSESEVKQYFEQCAGVNGELADRFAKMFIGYYQEREWKKKDGKPLSDWKLAVTNTWITDSRWDQAIRDYKKKPAAAGSPSKLAKRDE